MSTERQQSIARTLYQAERSGETVEPITAGYPDLTMDDAYAIQNQVVALYDSPILGLKAALTSKAKQIAMGVAQPGYGLLLDFMQCDGTLQTEGLIHPRVEPEIVLCIEQLPLTGKLTQYQVAESTLWYAPAFEVIDSRYKNFKFSAVDVFADNCSSARFSISPYIDAMNFEELNLLGVVYEKNGEIVHTGAPAAVMGSPFASAAFILNLAHRYNVALPERYLILTGGITEAVPVQPGDHLRATFGEIGGVVLSVI